MTEFLTNLTQKELKRLLHYDPETGIFRWRVDHSRIRSGKIAGSENCRGYIVITIHSQLYQAHRLAWLYVYGKFPESIIDHKNRLKSDNRINNLREASSVINGFNQKIRTTNNSGKMGVHFHKKNKKWIAGIGLNGKLAYIGSFEKKKDAIAARVAAEKMICPEVFGG